MKLSWLFRSHNKSTNPKATDDPRWQKLMTRGCECATCGEVHKGVFDLSFIGPSSWAGELFQEPNEAIIDAMRQKRDVLTSDFCIFGEHRYLRCVMPFQIVGTDQTFSFGIWGSINPAYFQDVLDRFDDGTQDQIGPYFSWLSNKLPISNEAPARARMEMQGGRQRPKLYLEEEEHPYFEKQMDGITISDLMEIYQSFGHDFGPSTQ